MSYDSDILTWSEQQAELLRRLSRGERVNGIDWDNLIEEIEELGRSEFKSVRSLLRNAIQHALKMVGWPNDPSRSHWVQECAAFLADARDRFEPGMAQRLDFSAIHADALAAVEGLEMPGQEMPLPPGMQFDLADLRNPRFGAAALVARLAAPSPSAPARPARP